MMSILKLIEQTASFVFSACFAACCNVLFLSLRYEDSALAPPMHWCGGMGEGLRADAGTKTCERKIRIYWCSSRACNRNPCSSFFFTSNWTPDLIHTQYRQLQQIQSLSLNYSKRFLVKKILFFVYCPVPRTS